MTGISINKYICSILKNNTNLLNYVVSNNIVSLYINPTEFPFISIMRNSITPRYVKEGLQEDNVLVQIDIILFINCKRRNYYGKNLKNRKN